MTEHFCLEEKRVIIKILKKYHKRDIKKELYYFFECLTLYLLFLGISVTSESWWVKSLMVIPISFILTRFFHLYHDETHDIFLDGFMKKVFHVISTITTCLPVYTWKMGHVQHHKGVTLNKFYPISIHIKPLSDYKNYSLKDKIIYRISHNFWNNTVFAIIFVWLILFYIIPIIKNPKKYGFDVMRSVILISLYALCINYFFGTDSLIFGFVLPLCVGTALGSYLFYVTHIFDEAQYRHDYLKDTVSTIKHNSGMVKMPTWCRWVYGNIGYHYIHHLDSNIPLYNLPACHAEIKDIIKPIEFDLLSWKLLKHTYLGFLYDDHQHKIITKSEYKKLISSDRNTPTIARPEPARKKTGLVGDIRAPGHILGGPGAEIRSLAGIVSKRQDLAD